MSVIDDIDGVKKALDLSSMRNMSNAKVMELVGLLNSGQISNNALAAIFAAAPELERRVSESMATIMDQLSDSNDRNSERFYDQMTQSKEFWASQASDPNLSAEEREEARKNYVGVDERVEEHDKRNKNFGLSLFAEHKEITMVVLGVSVTAIAAVMTKGNVKLPRLGK